MPESDPMAAEARETRLRIAHHLAELHRVHLALARESRGLKRFTLDGRAGTEIEIAAEMLEQYLGASGAFLENMRGRFEARLGLLRRGEPRVGANPEDAPGHGAFWLGFSRLCVVLRRAGGGC
jgi:hypothetical protein